MLTCMGFAAMITDHPLVLGSDNDDHVPAGAKLKHDGPSHRRALFLDKLRERLLDLADRRALHRTDNLVDAAVLAFLGKWCSYVGEQPRVLRDLRGPDANFNR